MGGCNLQYEFENENTEEFNEKTTFSYVRYNDCSPDGMLDMTGFSDAGCTRPLWRGQANLAQGVPGWNSCAQTGAEEFSRNMCNPKGGHVGGH